MNKSHMYLLMVLRFLSFILIAIMLLSPFIRNLTKIIREPLVITAWDNSASVVSAGDSLSLSGRINELKENITRELENDYTLVNYVFGQETKLFNDLDFADKRSDYSNLISTVINNHYNENIGALILAGDGTYNKGKNPVNMLEDITFPVYAIGLGDTTEIADASIHDIKVNRTSFAGNRFPVEINTRFIKLKGQTVKLSIEQQGKLLAEKVITPADNDFFQSEQFFLEAGSPGLKHYTARLEILKNERNKKNNIAEFVINVLKSKQKILIISDGVHPDIGAIKNTLEQQQSFEVSVFTEEPYPANLSDFNLVILNQLPTAGKSMGNITAAGENIRVPLLYIIGDKTYLPQMNVLVEGLEIHPLGNSPEEAQAVVNPSFATFTLSESLTEILQKWPPLQVPFANYRLEPEFNVIMYQKINNITTSKPLIATGIINRKKTGIIFGEGIWKWRLYDYYLNQSHKEFSELIVQLTQFLALRENEDNFMINYKPVYDEIDDVVMKAEVYNEAFEKITNTEVTILIKNEDDDELNFTFDVAGEEFMLNAGKLPVGDYSFQAMTTIGSQTHTEEGNFRVASVNIENVLTRANHRMLYQLANQSGGDFLLPSQAERLSRELSDSKQLKTVTYFQSMIHELLNLRWLFFVILLLLSMEWFLRKYWGLY